MNIFIPGPTRTPFSRNVPGNSRAGTSYSRTGSLTQEASNVGKLIFNYFKYFNYYH